MPTEFRNEPFTDFTKEESAQAMRAALDKVKSEFGREYPLVIGGERIKTGNTLESINPANRTQVVGKFHKATKELANQAVETAHKTFQTWRNVPAEERAQLLFRVAELMRQRKHELSAWMVYEVAKTWPEADGDTAEAIDFLEFYARELLRYASEQPLVKLTGEQNHLEYIPLGVGAVIPPWNFPCAIMAGMTVAAIVTGNTVILKPSSDSPTIAARFVDVLLEAGLPDGVVNFCPGSGATFGNAIVEHPKTRFIAFTGSKEVGLDIHARAAVPRKGQIWIKRTLLEMGGKDSIVVQADCNLDAAVEGVVASAFGFNGQKCSACSRAIVEEPIYDLFISRLRERVSQLSQGDPAENKNTGPVVNEGAMKSMLRYIE